MNPKINFPNLVRQLVPIHKRQPVRLRLFRALISPLQAIFAEFETWRTRIRMEINLNSQTAVLEGYLKQKYGKMVRIVTYEDGLLWIGLLMEDERFMPEFSDDGSARVDIPLAGEMRSAFGDYDFLVYIPANVSQTAIVAEIERYKKATATYRIIQTNTL